MGKSPLYLEELATDRLQEIDLLSRPSLITFIQPSCDPCKKQLEAMKCFFEQAGKEVQVLAVQTAGDSVDLARSIKKLRVPFPVLKGTEKFLSKFNALPQGTPFTVLVGTGETEKMRISGPRPCDFWLQQVERTKR